MKVKLNIKQKLFIILVFLTIIPIIVVTIVSYTGYSDLIDNQIITVSSSILNDSIIKVNNSVANVLGITETFVFQSYSPDNIVLDILRKYKLHKNVIGEYESFKNNKDLNFLFKSMLYSHNYINGVYLFTASGNSFYYSKANNDLKYEYTPEASSWYKKTLEMQGRTYISDVGVKNFTMSTKPSIFFSRLIKDPDTSKNLGVILIDCSLDIFNDIDKDIIPDQSNIILTDKTGKIIYESTRSKINTLIPEEIYNNIHVTQEGNFITNKGAMLIVFKSFPKNDWKLVAQISMNHQQKKFGPTKNILIMIVATCIFGSLIISFVLSGTFTKPIIELSNIMKSNRSNHLMLSKKYLDQGDEIATLYIEYNAMINEINDFIKERYQNKIILLDSQMMALEAQINSHFLYNTLESINSLAQIEGVESISIISKSLGDMFRYSIKTKSELVELEEELTHVQNYLNIQNIRYENKFQFTCNIPNDLLQEKILKLILQPIIENSLYHGLERKRGKGNIVLNVLIECNKIILDIVDDGIGMSDDNLENIKLSLQQSPSFTDIGRRDKRSIGIKNIHSRIQLYYGNEYGLAIESQQNIGTKVRIVIPKILSKEELA